MNFKKIIINLLIVSATVTLTLIANTHFTKNLKSSNQLTPLEKKLSDKPLNNSSTESENTIVEVFENSYPNDNKPFEIIGQSFIMKPDNKYLVDKYKFSSAFSSIKTFLLQPDRTICRQDYCSRKSIYIDSKFTIQSIVEPNGQEAKDIQKSNDSYSCKNNIIFCYYKAKFEDGEIGYILVADFNSASDPIIATASDMPSRLQIHPTNPDKSWKKSKSYYDKHFRKSGIREGYTLNEVLKSQWGKPYSQTHSTIGGTAVDIWTYNGGMITFQDGYVTQITTVQ